MTWALSTVISLLLRAADPLLRRGLPRLAVAAMATAVCGALLAAGYALGCAAVWLAGHAVLLAAVLLGVLGAALSLAARVGLVAVVLLLPLALTADCLSRRPGAEGDEHSRRIP
ncbi:hypothetical protein [Streptomyces lydicus]|uniref:hypothetical protein n=1 Tax=Streptomyces lydicus TaxID=47763 RepID=UPI00101242FA|nr:hypothetical protein [Streptomyces lydicus]